MSKKEEYLQCVQKRRNDLFGLAGPKAARDFMIICTLARFFNIQSPGFSKKAREWVGRWYASRPDYRFK